MTAIRDTIRNANRLTRMRMGQSIAEPFEVPSIKGESGEPLVLMQVPLSEAEVQMGLVAAVTLDVPDNEASLMLRNRVAAQNDVWHSLRDPADILVKAFESIDEMLSTLEPTDIDLAIDHLATLMDYSSPSIDGISEEVLDDLKADFARTDWSELSGRRWAAVKLCCQVLIPELLQARLRGSTSTPSSTSTSEESESTSTA